LQFARARVRTTISYAGILLIYAWIIVLLGINCLSRYGHTVFCLHQNAQQLSESVNKRTERNDAVADYLKWSYWLKTL
jgi:hypothetical protein